MKYLLFLLIVLLSCNNGEKLNSQTKENIISYNQFMSGIQLPETLTLCGEKIPLEDEEIRERAEREFYLLLQQPGQVILYLKRAGRYFDMYEEEIKKAGMPDDLKYLSVAESALFQARSSVGAIGLWQFMKETGQKMGLYIDDLVDERRHPQKSTVAALKYLRQGYQSHKSWLLTLAGYNMGHTGIKESLAFQSANDYFDLFLNEETSRFIFRIAIIKEIMSNPNKYGFDLNKIVTYKPERVKLIKVASAIPDLAQWAKNNGTNYKAVKLLNPWILKRQLQTPKSGFWDIAVPAK